MNCPFCGAENPEGAAFCNLCMRSFETSVPYSQGGIYENPAPEKRGRWSRKTIILLAIAGSVLLSIIVIAVVLVFAIPKSDTATFKSKTTSLSFNYPADLKESPGFGGGMTMEGVSTITEASLAKVSQSKEVEQGGISIHLSSLQSLSVTCIANATDELIMRESSKLSGENAGLFDEQVPGVEDVSFEKKNINGSEALIRSMTSDSLGDKWTEYELGMKVSNAYYLIKFSGKSELDNDKVWNQIVSSIKFQAVNN